MNTTDISHLGLGTLLAPIKDLTRKETLMNAAKLGAGAAGGIVGANFLLSKLVKDGQPIVPRKWSPLAMAVAGVLGGGIAKRFVGDKIATGIIAGTVGAALSQVVMGFAAPAVAAVEQSASAHEDAGMGPQMGGLGTGRAFARGLAGLSGRALSAGGASQVYGIGTPDMSASRMFNGATVAIEETGGQMAGATVEIEETSNLAGFLQ